MINESQGFESTSMSCKYISHTCPYFFEVLLMPENTADSQYMHQSK